MSFIEKFLHYEYGMFNVDTLFSLIIPALICLYIFSKMDYKQAENSIAIAIGVTILHCAFFLRPDINGLRLWPVYMFLIPGLYYAGKVKDAEDGYFIAWVSMLGIDVYHCLVNHYYLEGKDQGEAMSGIGGAGIEDGLFSSPIFVAFVIIIIPIARKIGMRVHQFEMEKGWLLSVQKGVKSHQAASVSDLP